MSGGLLIFGRIVPVPGVTVIGPHDAKWSHLSAGDCRRRSAGWVRQFLFHTTKGEWPQRIVEAPGPTGRAERTAEMWLDDPTYSGAQLVSGSDGVVACLADLGTTCAFHATTSNDWSDGIEVYQEAGGVIHRPAITSAIAVAKVACRELGIPWQIASDDYREGHIIERMLHGGPDCVGLFGHRDQAWKFPWQMETHERARYPEGYAARGRGDPGDEVYRAAIAAGAEPLNYGKREDIAVCKRRQAKLNAMGEKLVVDGIAGPSYMAALKRHGFVNGHDLDTAAEAQ